jgi:predicted dehydrogenase
MMNWGLIGCGWLARDYVAPVMHASHYGHLRAAFDPNPHAAASVGAEVVHDSLESLLADAAVESVYIATPNHLHCPQTLAALAAGKHVICEKPTAVTLAEAEQMHAAARDAGLYFATAFDQQHHAAHHKLRELVAMDRSGFGEPTTVRIRYACWTGNDWRPPGDVSDDNWRVDPSRAGGGAMIDLAPHGLDLVQYILDEPIEEVRAMLQRKVHRDVPVDDGAVIVGRTRSGVLVDLNVSYNCPEVFPRRTLEVVGTKAMLIATDTMGQTPGGKLQRIDGVTGRREPISYRDREVSPFATLFEMHQHLIHSRVDWYQSTDRELTTMRLLDACVADWSFA